MQFHTHNKKGFTILFAIVIVSVVVSIGISLSLLALKEFAFSNTLRESQFAYYAAETGTQCALYYLSSDPTSFTNNATQHIICNGEDQNFTNLTSVSPGTTRRKLFHFADYVNASEGKSYPFIYYVTIYKTGEPRNIEITTEGYNTGGTVAVKTQRRQKLQVESGSIATNPDVVVTVDNSGSIDDEGVLQCEKNAVNAFIDSPELGLSANGTHVAFHRYRSYAQIRQGLTDDTAALHSAVNTLPTSSGGSSGTNLQAGLKLAQYELTNGNNTDRVDTGANGHPDVLIIVGDGDPTSHLVAGAVTGPVYLPQIGNTFDSHFYENCGNGNPRPAACIATIRTETLQAATDFKGTGGQIYTISVGAQDNAEGNNGNDYLQSISSGSGYFYKVDNYCSLGVAFKSIGKKIIKIIE
jgi:hypothetical protein